MNAPVATLIRERLRNKTVTSFWKLRTPPGASFAHQVHQAKIPSRFLALIFAYLGEYALWILSWWLIGKAALERTFDSGWRRLTSAVLNGPDFLNSRRQP